MRFMVLIKANQDTEAGVMPSEQLLAEMGRYNEELVSAGVMLGGEGLHPSAKGARVLFQGADRQVVDGPFAETKELLAGYWLWQVASKEEALDWIRRCPNPTGDKGVVELRQVFEAEDFGPEFTPALQAQEDTLRAQVATAAAASAAVTGAASSPAVPAVPPARGAIPYLTIKGAAAAIDFYQQAFGAEVVMRLDDPAGEVMHCELRVGPASLMLTEERPQYQALGPLTLGGSGSTVVIYVPDVDAVVAAAVAAGARLVMPVMDQFWGDRSGSLIDPFGHQWMVSTQRETPLEDEVRRRLQAMFSAGDTGCGSA
jgi:uncharacterized glyoxalase superfamily protein PhnB